MNIIYKKCLSKTEKNDVLLLFQACQNYDSLTLSCPADDCSFLLLYDNHILCSAFSLFFPEPGICECLAFTHPSMRRKGCFTQLLLQTLDLLEEREQEHDCETELCFITDRRCDAALNTLEALETELWYEEYKMVLPLPSVTETIITPHKGLILSEKENGFYEARIKGRPVGSFCLLKENTTACLYNLEVKKSKRRQGIGTALLNHILLMLTSEGMKQITLQVSSLNHPATRLYEKTGFQTLESLSYYIY